MCVCSLNLTHTVTLCHLSTQVSATLQHKSHTDVTSPMPLLSCCIHNYNQFLFLITIRLTSNITCVLPPLPLPSRFSSKHNQPHSASTMRHYASLVATLFSKSSVRPPCPPPPPPCHKVNSIKFLGKSDTW